ncbi:solute carrier family 17 member 9-like isoform X2 [Branchiostoma floridae]|uniref:Solute carrier family 17 member 9-like isoform X2 n=1 Tax=Branchiostoma floridae TaxID=7739 RepID=A0A9J7HWM7_BRAFL|nr:solute carrier family 17 member 9-like isoform X2 [Branchiostoma floridae]
MAAAGAEGLLIDVAGARSASAVKEHDQGSQRYWKRTEKRQWVLAYFIGNAILYASRAAMPVCVPAIAKEFSWDKTVSGSVLSVFFWGYASTQVLGGYLSDRFGGEVISMVAAVGWSTITLLYPQLLYLFSSHDTCIRFVILCRILHGACQGVAFPAESSLVAQNVKTDRTATYTIMHSGIKFGALLMGCFGSIVLVHLGWHTVFYVTGVVGLLWAAVMRIFFVSRRNIVSIKSLNGSNEEKKRPHMPWRILCRKTAFLSAIVAHVCNNNLFFIMFSWMPTYFHETYPDQKGWIFNVVPWLVSMPGSVLSGWIADSLIRKGTNVTLTRKMVEIVGMGGPVVCLLLTDYTNSFVMALMAVSMGMFSQAFHNSGVLVIPQDIAPSFAGAVFGVMNMLGAIPGVVGVYLAGHILELTGSWAAVFHLTAAINTFGLLVFLVYGSAERIV